MAKLHGILIRTLLIYMCLMTECCNANDEVCMASIGVGRAKCPSAWIQWKDKCFKATQKKLDWFQAHEECSKMGGVMATPSSTEDTQLLLSITHNADFWIDCNELDKQGVWECKEGDTAIYYRDWGGIEPNDYLGRVEECAKFALKLNGWNDLRCSYPTVQELAVCMKPVPSLHFLHV